MKHSKKALALILLLIWVLPAAAFAQSATSEEVVTKVRAAADFLSKRGAKGVAQFNMKKSNWVWKDTYIFVLKCDEFTLAAHPFAPQLIGRDNSGLVDKKGSYFFIQFCDDAEKYPKKGSWMEYWWPKKGEAEPVRKVSYTLQVPGQPYQVSAGIYSPTITAAELNAKLK
jgi:cytochrome c